MRQKLMDYTDQKLNYIDSDLDYNFDYFFKEFYERDIVDTKKIKDKDRFNIKDKDLYALNNEELVVIYQKGNEKALEILINKNQKLIYSRVEKYKNTYRQDLEYEDLFQEGSIGMITAAKKFDVNLGYKFSTYATHWIDQGIMRKIENDGFTIRIPTHVFENINRLRREVNEVEFLDISYSEKLKLLMKYTGFSIEEINNLNRIYSDILNSSSLNLSVYGDNGQSISEKTELLNLVADSNNEDVFEIVSNNLLRRDLEKVLSTLTKKEKNIVKKRFGLIGEKVETLEEIGAEYNLTRERIRQIEKDALDKLKKPYRAKLIKEYLY